MRITAFYLAEAIDLRRLRESYSATLISDNPSELFYRVDENSYFFVFDYGIAVFANMQDVEVSKHIILLKDFSQNSLTEKISDDFVIEQLTGSSLKFHFDSLGVPSINEDVIRITMLNLAQSVALDYFVHRGDNLLAEIRRFTDEMEQTGSISINRKNMIKFIGRTLNSKNKIIENLFIFDSPDQTWEDEYLDQIHRGLVRTFELPSRFKEVEYTFKVVEENLEVIRELYFHREGSKLEWVIIVLICIEVFDLLISRVFS